MTNFKMSAVWFLGMQVQLMQLELGTRVWDCENSRTTLYPVTFTKFRAVGVQIKNRDQQLTGALGAWRNLGMMPM